jgi:predicted  nucleic acid-binding Zn-ribbon protein
MLRMLQEIEQLLIMQDRDRKIRALKAELKASPMERKEWEDKLAAANRQLEAVKLKGKELEVERKKLENEAQSKRDTIAKYQTQKFQTRKNEEFQALTNEITRYERDVSLIEDRELELMESAEQMKVTIATSEKEAASVKEQVARQLAKLVEKADAIQAQLKDLEAERAKLAGAVEEDLLDTYTRLFTSKGDNAVVPLEHEVCMGCHMKLTTQTAVKVKGRRDVVHCEQCGRILYWEG